MVEMNLSQLPKGWTWTTLGQIRLDKSTSINPIKTPDKLFELYSVPSFDEEKPEITEGAKIGSNKQAVDEDTVLLCKINPRINRVWVVGNFSNWEKIASTEWIAFFNISGISSKYLRYFLMNNDFRSFLSLNVSGVGGSLMRVKPSTLAQYPFPLAPTQEQHRIVARIEELFSDLDAGVVALKKAKAQLRLYRQAVLKAAFDGRLTAVWREAHKGELGTASELLERIRRERRNNREGPQERLFEGAKKDLPQLPSGWAWTHLGEIGTVSGGLTKNAARKNFPLKLPYLRVANVYARELRLHDVNYIGLKDSEVRKALLEEGDVLVVEGNGSIEQIGRVALWDGSIPRCVHQNHIIKVRFNIRELGNYIVYWLCSPEGRDYITEVASSTSGLYTLSISKVARLSIPLAPLSEQLMIVQEIEQLFSIIDELERTVDNSLKRSERLRQGILKKAFAGELVPQDPEDEAAAELLKRIKAERGGHTAGKKPGHRGAQRDLNYG